MITDDMRSILGKPMETAVSYPVSASDIRRWAIAVYHPETPPRVHWDEDDAATIASGGVVAPEEFNPFAWGARTRKLAAAPPQDSAEGVGSPEARHGVAPPLYQHLLNGGLEHEYSGVPIRPGDVITSTSAIVDYREREGRLGLMLFTTIENSFVNQDGELVSTQRLTLIRY
jgi:hypothetical protein